MQLLRTGQFCGVEDRRVADGLGAIDSAVVDDEVDRTVDLFLGEASGHRSSIRTCGCRRTRLTDPSSVLPRDEVHKGNPGRHALESEECCAGAIPDPR